MLAFLPTRSAISFNILSVYFRYFVDQNVLGIIMAFLHIKSAISFNILSVQMI